MWNYRRFVIDEHDFHEVIFSCVFEEKYYYLRCVDNCMELFFNICQISTSLEWSQNEQCIVRLPNLIYMHDTECSLQLFVCMFNGAWFLQLLFWIQASDNLHCVPFPNLFLFLFFISHLEHDCSHKLCTL